MLVVGVKRGVAGCCLCPAEVFFTCGQLEVEFGDAKVDSGKGGNLGSGFDGWKGGGGGEKGEMEVLPVHGRGGEHGTFDSTTEPFGFAVDVGEGGDGFAGVLFALCEAVADSDYGDIHFVVVYAHVVVARECAANPTSVQSEGLCQKDEAFAFVAEVFMQTGRLLAYHGDVVGGSAKTEEFGKNARKGFGVVEDELHVQVFGGVALGNLLAEDFGLLFGQRAVAVLPYGMAYEGGFL